jgi:hypothetical protein
MHLPFDKTIFQVAVHKETIRSCVGCADRGHFVFVD